MYASRKAKRGDACLLPMYVYYYAMCLFVFCLCTGVCACLVGDAKGGCLWSAQNSSVICDCGAQVSCIFLFLLFVYLFTNT